jgi:elongation factor P hydroxylase
VTLAIAAGDPTDKFVEAVRGEVRPQDAMEYMRAVYATDRWFTSSKFQETAETVKRAMIAIGLEEVTIEAVPANGVTQFGYWTEPLAWDAKSARLEDELLARLGRKV